MSLELVVFTGIVVGVLLGWGLLRASAMNREWQERHDRDGD